MEKRKTDVDDTLYDAIQIRRMQRFMLGFAIFTTPLLIALCIICFLLSGSWYVFLGLSGLLLPGMIFWRAYQYFHPISEEVYQHKIQKKALQT